MLTFKGEGHENVHFSQRIYIYIYKIRKEGGQIKLSSNTRLLRMHGVTQACLNFSCITCTYSMGKAMCCPECRSVHGNAYFKLYQTLRI